MAGIQGCGVSTPRAAAVAAATAGLANDVHIPKLLMFTMGAASPKTQIGFPCANTLRLFVPVSGAGMVPKEQAIVACDTTVVAM